MAEGRTGAVLQVVSSLSTHCTSHQVRMAVVEAVSPSSASIVSQLASGHDRHSVRHS
jgi:hypothetical protein